MSVVTWQFCCVFVFVLMVAGFISGGDGAFPPLVAYLYAFISIVFLAVAAAAIVVSVFAVDVLLSHSLYVAFAIAASMFIDVRIFWLLLFVNAIVFDSV